MYEGGTEGVLIAAEALAAHPFPQHKAVDSLHVLVPELRTQLIIPENSWPQPAGFLQWVRAFCTVQKPRDLCLFPPPPLLSECVQWQLPVPMPCLGSSHVTQGLGRRCSAVPPPTWWMTAPCLHIPLLESQSRGSYWFSFTTILRLLKLQFSSFFFYSGMEWFILNDLAQTRKNTFIQKTTWCVDAHFFSLSSI